MSIFNSIPNLSTKIKKIKDKCDPLLENDARMTQEWIVEDGNDDESEGSINTCFDTIWELDDNDFNSEEEPKMDKNLCLLRWIKIVGDILKVWMVLLIFLTV